MLVLDDLHWADQASLDFVRYLARQLHDHALLFVATYREDELTRRHPLALLLPRMTREARRWGMHLRSLDDPAVEALVARRYRLPAPTNGGWSDTSRNARMAIPSSSERC